METPSRFFIMTKLNFITSTKKDLWDEIKRLEGEQGEPEVCDGQCSEDAKRFLQPVHAWPWRLQVGPAHVNAEYCPFCGRKLNYA